ncbi:type I restriction endonuclease subunit R, EcoR124 family, partial [Thiolapillus sp.]|uniref:type I restriction endonuclease subunit R, EcoR124 family n=1 Tax=Thiolapillus sp. TaxID=2017437 RepID=UPI003AF9FCAC
DMIEYINTLTEGKGLDEQAIREGYERFKAEKNARELAVIAEKHGLSPDALQGFIDSILSRRVFDPDALTELLRPLGLGWKVRAQKELELMDDLTPLLRKQAEGQEISGLEVYEQ